MWELVRANKRRTLGVFFVMALLLGLLGYSLWGEAGLVLALVIWAIQASVSYFSGDKIILAFHRAKKISRKDHPVLFNVVEEMTIASGLKKIPDIYIIDDPAPNAFATGKDPHHASVAVTTGLLTKLNRDELQGVIGHEIGHIQNRDILLMTVAATMVGTIILLADFGRRMLFYGGYSRTHSRSRRGGQGDAIFAMVALVLIILAPLFAQLLYFALSRRREYLADASSAIYTRNPEGLAGALEKLQKSTQQLKVSSAATAPLYIVNPLKVSSQGLADITSTHPPISKRIQILRSMAGTISFQGYDEAFRKVTGRPVGVIPFQAPEPSGAPISKGKMAGKEPSHIEKVRQVTDMLWNLQGFIFIPCPCGTTLKIPPEYKGKTIPCPHCQKNHIVQ